MPNLAPADHSGGLSLSSGKKSAIGRSNPCPCLGSTEGPRMPFGYASKRNACYAQKHVHRKGLRKIEKPYSAVSRERQEKLCFDTFTECPHYQEFINVQEKAAHKAPRKAPAAKQHAEGGGAHRRKKRKPEKSPGRISKLLTSSRLRGPMIYGAVLFLAVAAAFAIHSVMAAKPSRLVMFVFNTILQNDIKSFGMKSAGIADRSKISGVSGGNLRAMKGMSKAKLEKLKGSGAASKLTGAQKAKIRKMMGK